MKTSKSVLAILLSSLLLACTSNSVNEPVDVPPESSGAIKTTELISDGEINVQGQTFDRNFNSNPKYINLAKSNDFALKLANVTAERNENFTVSPLSIQTAFALLANGADNNTYREITETIGMKGLSRDELREYSKLLYSHYIADNSDDRNSDQGSKVLQIANSTWVKNGFPLYESFCTSSKNYFDAETYTIDFAADDAATAINEWVKEKTYDRISKILENRDVANLAVLLLNTVYMKASWAESFHEQLNEKKVFHNSNGTSSECVMMHATRRHNYYAGENFEVASLPLGEGAYMMNIILPNHDVSVESVLDNLQSETLEKVTASWKVALLDLMIPKFSLQSDLDILGTMNALGIYDAFTGNAEFRSLTPNRVYVSKVKHNTYIDVNEKGIEAAAATAINLWVSDHDSDHPTVTPVTFHVDRPFLFTIQDTETGSIIFIGRMQNVNS